MQVWYIFLRDLLWVRSGGTSILGGSFVNFENMLYVFHDNYYWFQYILDFDPNRKLIELHGPNIWNNKDLNTWKLDSVENFNSFLM